jgi:ligand-binding SRPBCC domain-containing protein
MGKLHHEVAIDAPAGDVWRVLADLEQVQHYNPLVAQARYVSSNREGVGAARRCEFKPKGFSVERVIEWHPEELLGLEVVESSWPLRSSRWWTKLSRENGRTHVSQELEYEPKFGLLGKAMDAAMMRRKMDKVVAEIFDGLKAFVEAK